MDDLHKGRTRKLIQALKSGGYKKGIGRLRKSDISIDDKLCCQGVGCELALQDENRGFNLDRQRIADGLAAAFYVYGNDIISSSGSHWPSEVAEYYFGTLYDTEGSNISD